MPPRTRKPPAGKPEENGVKREVSIGGKHLTLLKVVHQVHVALRDDKNEIVADFPAASFVTYKPDFDKFVEQMENVVMPQIEQAWMEGKLNGGG
jgi:hypothetical protein